MNDQIIENEHLPPSINTQPSMSNRTSLLNGLLLGGMSTESRMGE